MDNDDDDDDDITLVPEHTLLLSIMYHSVLVLSLLLLRVECCSFEGQRVGSTTFDLGREEEH